MSRPASRTLDVAAAPSLKDDLAYVRDLAEAGATAPTLSGRFGLWWTGLLAVTLVAHWAVLVGAAPVPGGPGLLWLAYPLVGLAGTAVLVKTMGEKPGQSTPGNRTERIIWFVVLAGLVTYQLSITAAVLAGRAPPMLYDTITPTAFLLSGVVSAVSAVLFRTRTPWWTTAVMFATAALVVLNFGRPEAYLVAAAGVVAGMTAPAVAALMREPRTVV